MTENIYKNRHLETRLPKGKQKKLVLITGARQTGKTTIAKNQYSKLNYLNLDAPEIREAIRQVPTHTWVRDIGTSILDEVQKEPIALEKIKYCFDEDTLQFSVLLGSSQLMLLKKVRESLAGRVSLYELFPFMVSEVIQDGPLQAPLIDQIISHPLADAIDSIPSLLLGEEEQKRREAHDYILKWGGMPNVSAITKCH